MTEAEQEELNRLRLAMTKLNRLRSNVVCTQNAGWSNQMYPFVAILNEAGYEQEGATDEQCEEHLHCYGGAGKTPTLLDHTPAPESMLEWLRERGLKDDHPMSGSIQIHAERWRQVDEEGFDTARDDQYQQGELVRAAIAYAAAHQPGTELEDVANGAWPWDATWWMSTDALRDLDKAGALLAAEIDRLQRVGSAHADP